jgi:hypothetical protein
MDVFFTVLAIILAIGLIVALLIAAGVTFAGVKVARKGQRKLEQRQAARDRVTRIEACSSSREIRGSLEALSAGGDHDGVMRCLDRGLPAWPVREPFLATARELDDMRRALPRATAAGVAPGVVSRLDDEVGEAATLLWQQAERLAAAAAIFPGAGGPPEKLAATLAADEQQLAALGTALREARGSLADLALSGVQPGRELEPVERRFRAISAAARELTDDALPAG